MEDIYYFDPVKGERVKETVMGERLIKWAYQDSSVSYIQKLLFHNKVLSSLLGCWFNSGFSRRKIKKTIEELGIDPDEFRDSVSSYATFNQFFTRHLKLDEVRPYSRDDRVLVSPADGRVLVFPDYTEDTLVPIKGARYSIKELLGIDDNRFNNGSLAVIRLCPADYHRFHYPCAGSVVYESKITGLYHSVNPIPLAQGIDVFTRNKRSVSVLETDMFGAIAYVEVGAFGVGSIKRTNVSKEFQKMDERGYFEFGGSTVILVFQEGRVAFTETLCEQSSEGVEVLMKVGETLGTSPQK